MMVDDGTVFMVDDDASVRDSLALLLSLKGLRMQAFADGESFLAAYRDTSAGCLLTDLRMPGISGLAVQSALRGRGGSIPVIVLTAYGDLDTARAAFKGGAFDFLEKPVDQAALLEVLEAALRVDRMRRSQLTSESAPGLDRLTAREREIAKLMAAGHQNREIAMQLGISHRTVEVHRAHVMDKLQCRSLADLMRLKLSL
jgi:FixJ family two-component response regulator